MANYLPLFRPADTVTFTAAAAIVGGQPLEIGSTDWSAQPAGAASAKYVGVAGHDAAPGEKVTVEVGKPIHEFVASASIAVGAGLEPAGSGKVQTATTSPKFLALSAAEADGKVAAIQL